MMIHNQRFQQQLLDEVDATMQKANDELVSKERALKDTQTAREDLAIAYGQMKNKVEELSRTVKRQQQDVVDAQHKFKVVGVEKAHVESENNTLRKTLDDKVRELDYTRVLLDGLQKELHNTRKITDVYNSELK